MAAEGLAQHYTQQFLDSAGAPMAAAEVYHYQPGGTVLENVWLDKARAVTANQPILTDATGRVSFWGDADYRLVVFNSGEGPSGSAVYDWDSVRITRDVFPIWAGSSGAAYPSMVSTNTLQAFLKVDGAGLPSELAFNDGITGWLPFARELDPSIIDVTQSPYDAVGNGIADDTAAIQAAIDAAGAGDEIYFPKPSSFYKVTEAVTGYCLKIDTKSDIRLYGQAQIKVVGSGTAADDLFIIKLLNTCTNITIEGLKFLGEETPANDDATAFQIGVGCNSNQTITNVQVIRCEFENLEDGVTFNANLGGTASDCVVAYCKFKNIVGGGGAADLSGQGYAVHTAGKRNRILYNEFDSTGRHDIYIANSDGDMVIGNISRNHRVNNTVPAIRAAFQISRSENIIVAHNHIEDFYDGAITVLKETATSQNCLNILIDGNTIKGNQSPLVPCIWVGEQLGSSTYFTSNVNICNNMIFFDGADPGLAEWLRILNGIGIYAHHNSIYATGLSAITHDLTRLGQANADGYTLLGNTNHIRVNDNNFYIRDYAGATVRLFRFQDCPIIENNAMQCEVLDNHVFEDGTGTFAHDFFVAVNANHFLEIRDKYRTIETIAAAASISLLPTGNIFRISVGTGTIDAIVASWEGRVVTLIFDAAVIVTEIANIVTAGAFTSVATDTMTLMYDTVGAKWLEMSRSANGV